MKFLVNSLLMFFAVSPLLLSCDKNDDGQAMELKRGGIRLGSHQTDLKFVLPPIPDKIRGMAIDIPAFRANEAHQTIFSYKLNGKTDHTILSSQNDFQTTISFTPAVQSSHRLRYIPLCFLGLFLILKMRTWGFKLSL